MRLICFGMDTPAKPAAKSILMGQAELAKCPDCGAYLTLTLPPEGKGKRTFQCFDCDPPDPMKTEKVFGWLMGELQPPKDPRAAD
jgi:hypothetical protein